MRRIGIAARVLLVIALMGLGLPAGVPAEGDSGLVAEWRFDRRVCVSGFMITITKRLIPEVNGG